MAFSQCFQIIRKVSCYNSGEEMVLCRDSETREKAIYAVAYGDLTEVVCQPLD